MSEYMSVQETAAKWGVSGQRVRLLCLKGRISGVERLGKAYMIPKNSEKPQDPRKRKSEDIQNNMKRNLDK